MKKGPSATTAFRFVLVLGIANLFADMTYEGARSSTGQFLGTLGASAAVIGFTAGLGELLGYVLRSVSGLIADKTGKYWVVAIVGYVVNMLAVPALALAGNWPLAAGLIISERTGRAIRKPATEAMLSFAGKHIGQGWVFGLNEALDQTGAAIGPLILSFTLWRKGNYQAGFGLLLIPALFTIAIVLFARYFFPNPHDLEPAEEIRAERFSSAFWYYLAANACIGAGLADFALIGYHFQNTAAVGKDLIPVYYAAAMATGALGGLIFGKLFDKFGLVVLLGIFFLSAFFAPLVFLGHSWVALLGMILWGLGMAAQGSLINAVIAGVVPANKRSSAFGLFDTGFGIAWFIGSALMGILYNKSLLALIAFSVALQLLSLPLFLVAKQNSRRSRSDSM
ncbi:MAG: MFS transporter [Chthoniobacterales bacterium]